MINNPVLKSKNYRVCGAPTAAGLVVSDARNATRCNRPVKRVQISVSSVEGTDRAPSGWTGVYWNGRKPRRSKQPLLEGGRDEKEQVCETNHCHHQSLNLSQAMSLYKARQHQRLTPQKQQYQLTLKLSAGRRRPSK